MLHPNQRCGEIFFWFVFNAGLHSLAALVMLSLAMFASAASAQQLITPVPSCQTPKGGIEAYPTPKPMTYPATSDQYAVQYRLDNSAWTTAIVYDSIIRRVKLDRHGSSDSGCIRRD